MKRKRNFVWRAALLLMTLAVTTSALSLSRAKYIDKDQEFEGEFEVWSIISFKGDGTKESLPKGKWAFYARGGNGQSAGTSNGGLGAAVKGIYTKANNGTFTIGTIPGGAKAGNNTGGNGGHGTYILDDITSPPTGVGNGSTVALTAAQLASLKGIVAVAGGGGGAGRNSNNFHGGNAGGGGATQNGPWSTTSGIQSGSQGTWDGTAGTPSSAKNHSSGGGGDGRQGNWWEGGRRGTDDLGGGGGSDGGWFYAAPGSSNTSYATGGGGGGIFGGGGGAGQLRLTAGGGGSGGGGASYIAKTNDPTTTTGTATTTVPTTKFNPPTTYYEYAVNYFIDNEGKTDSLLVWLGP